MDNVKNSFEELKNLLLSAVDLMENIGEELETRVLVMEKKLLDMERRMEEYESVKRSDGFDDILAAGGVVSAADVIEAAAVEKESDIIDVATEEATIATTTSSSAAAAEEEEEEAEHEPEFEPDPEFVTEETEEEEVAAVEPAVGVDEEEEVLAEESAAEDIVAVAENEKTVTTDYFTMAFEEEKNSCEMSAGDVKTEECQIRVVGAGYIEVKKTEIGSIEGENVKSTEADDSYKVAAEADVVKEETGTISVNDAAKPDWYDWEVDYPAAYIDDIYKGISFNDRYEFVKELFNVTGNLSEAEIVFKETLDDINCMDNFKEVVAYIRHRFPQWDELSDEVYRFYMIVRRKFNN